MKLLSVKTTNFKKLKSGEKIDLNGDLNILVGMNNAGKTSVLQAIACAFNLKMQFTLREALNYLVKNGEVEVAVEFYFSELEWEIVLSQKQHEYPESTLTPALLTPLKLIKRVSVNHVGRDASEIHSELIIADPVGGAITEHEQNQRHLDSSIAIFQRLDFNHYFGSPMYMGNQRELVKEEPFRPIRDIRAKSEPNTIREKLYVIKRDQPEVFARIQAQVLDAFPELSAIDILHDEERGVFSLAIEEDLRKNGSYETVNYDIHTTGLGMQSLILIVANILIQDSSVVLLDEPEVHMHPSLVKKFVQILETLAPEKQIILTSHSIPLINTVPTEKVFTLKYRPDEKGIIAEPASKEKETIEILREIGFDVKNEIFTYAPRNKKIVFVEGAGDEEYLSLFASRFHLADDELPIFEVLDGKSNAFSVARTIQKLKKAKEEQGLNFMITLDQDEDKTKGLSDLLTDSELFIWQKRQIENYLLDPATIASLTGQQEETIRAQLEEVINTQEEDLLFLYLQELFIGWSLSNAKEMRTFLREHKGEPIDAYEGELQKLIMIKLIDATTEAKRGAKSLEAQFADRWAEDKWEICDGKKALQALRHQHAYHFSNTDIIRAMESCPEEIRAFWERCQIVSVS